MNELSTRVKVGLIYAASDGSVQRRGGDHGFGFTSGMERTAIWGSAAVTRGNLHNVLFKA